MSQGIILAIMIAGRFHQNRWTSLVICKYLWGKSLISLLYTWFETGPGRSTRKPLVNLIRFHKLERGEAFIVVVAKLLSVCIGETSIAQMWRSEGINEFFSGGTDVYPLFRGIGVGRRMLSIALQEARNAFMAPIYVNIPCDNRYSLQLYQKVGFEIVET
jgi:GNAT superfamily N-acetyltransferase